MPNRDKFEEVCKSLSVGVPLNLKMVGDIFGEEFYLLLLLLSANVDIKTDGKIDIHIHVKE